MIEFDRVSCSFGNAPALRAVSFREPDGQITGLVGPNGAGKTTALNILMGLRRPNSGRAVFDGSSFVHANPPLSTAGALISPEWIPVDRPAITVLLALAVTHAIPKSRCRDLMQQVGLGDVIDRRVSTFSLGMRQRLGIAIALLGDPRHLVLDEPVNGLDPEGVAWVREFLKSFTRQGRTVLLSSHVMSELENTADRIVVLSEGRVVADDEISRIVSPRGDSTYVEANELAQLLSLLRLVGCSAIESGVGAVVDGMSARDISAVALRAGIVLGRLEPRQHSLEQAFFDLTKTETIG